MKDLDLKGSSTFTLPANKSFDISGDIINPNPAQYTLLGTVNFAGGNQTIPAFTFNGLTISGSGSITKTLAGPLTVNGTLTLTNGVLITSNSNMLTVAATGSISGYNSTSYVQGPLTRFTNSAGSYDFPIGIGSLRVVTITPVSTLAGSYTVKYNASSPTISSILGNVGGIQVNEYWDITRSSGPDVLVGLSYINPNSTTAWSSNTNPCSTCNVGVVQGIVFSGNTNWNFTGSGGGFGPTEATYWQSNGTVFSRQVSSFGQFGFGYAYAIILPVTLEYFNGGMIGNKAHLNWKFADATGLSETILEQSSDGIHFFKLATFVKDQYKDSYNYEPGNLPGGIHYYRLKMVTSDGKISFSKIISLVSGAGISYFHGIRPTVVSGDVYIDLHSAANQKMQVRIFDVNGRLSYAGKNDLATGENHYKLFAGGLIKGWYYVRVTLEDGSSASYRFVKE